MQILQSLLIPIQPVPRGFPVENTASQTPSRRFPSRDPDAARRAYYAKKNKWAKLSLRQTWADEPSMRLHLQAAGVKVANNTEPATVPRMRSLLRKAGVDGPEIVAAVGTSLAKFLELNPSLPLWAAVALILESTGRFSVQ